MSFVGNSELTLDTKGRLILPSKYRDELAAGVYLVTQDGCLAIMPVEVFDAKAEHLEARVHAGELSMHAFRFFTGNAESVVPDSQGRIRISPKLREEADLDRTVVLSGVLQYLEVWNPERFEQVSAIGAPDFARAIGDGIATIPSTKPKGEGEANP